MARGIIYIMTTAVPGLIKIGKTGSNNYEQRMYNLEHDGYRNVTALKRAFAIEVDEYDAKETLLHTIFEKSRVADTELFALDVNVAVQLLSSFEGNVVYPKTETKEELFTDAVDATGTNITTNVSRRPHFVFSMCGLKPGDMITFVRDKSKTATIIDEKHVLYNSKTYTLSGLALELLNEINGTHDTHGVRGSLYFEYQGKTLQELREERENR